MGGCLALGVLKHGLDGKKGGGENVGTARGEVRHGKAFMEGKAGEFSPQFGEGV